MDILDILLDILLKPPQPFIGLFLSHALNQTKPVLTGLSWFQPTRVDWCKAPTALLEISTMSQLTIDVYR